MATSHIFHIMFVNQGKVYEVYARKVSHGELFGFIEVEELLFGERSSVVLDPGEERIKGEFTGVKRTFLPMHSVLRIDEVKKHGVSKITALERAPTSRSSPCPSTRRRRARRSDRARESMLQLAGPPALSAFRIAKLLERLSALDPAVDGRRGALHAFRRPGAAARRARAAGAGGSC